MTVSNGKPDFVYKVGVSDDVTSHLTQNKKSIDLTGVTLTLNIKDITNPTNRIEVPCTVGGIVSVNGVDYSEVEGGCTINFANSDLSIKGEYHCELVGTKNGTVWFRIPYNNDYLVLMVYPEV
jgi:hypothetical protein